MFICEKKCKHSPEKQLIFWGREEREESVLYTGMFKNIN